MPLHTYGLAWLDFCTETQPFASIRFGLSVTRSILLVCHSSNTHNKYVFVLIHVSVFFLYSAVWSLIRIVFMLKQCVSTFKLTLEIYKEFFMSNERFVCFLSEDKHFLECLKLPSEFQKLTSGFRLFDINFNSIKTPAWSKFSVERTKKTWIIVFVSQECPNWVIDSIWIFESGTLST